MDNLLSTGDVLISRFTVARTQHLFKLRPKNHPFLFSTATLAILLLTFTVTPAVVGQRRGTEVTFKNLAKCRSDLDCDNSHTFLKCHNNVCVCAHIHFFSEDHNRCLIRAGGSCEPKNFKQFCVPYASCDTRSKPYGTSGVCKCNKNFKETIENTCVSGAGSRYFTPNYFLLISLPVAILFLQLALQRRQL